MNVPYYEVPLNQKNQISQKTQDFRVKYKTEKCRYWTSQGFCPYGDVCAFAHLDVEMRQKAIIHSRYKTKACNNFAKTGSCKYGDRCLFLHAETKIKIQTRDRDRTRSNSPVSNCQKKFLINPQRHRKNLRIFENYGEIILSRHLSVNGSRLLRKQEEEVEREFQNQFSQFNSLILTENLRKERLNSM